MENCIQAVKGSIETKAKMDANTDHDIVYA